MEQISMEKVWPKVSHKMKSGTGGTGRGSEHTTWKEGAREWGRKREWKETVLRRKTQRNWTVCWSKGETLKLTVDPLPSCFTVTSLYKTQISDFFSLRWAIWPFQILWKQPRQAILLSLLLVQQKHVSSKHSEFQFRCMYTVTGGFPHSSVNKESACHAGHPGSIPGLGRFPGEGNGNPLQCSWLENLMDKGAWQATVHGVTRVRHDLVTKPPPPTL